MAEGQRRGRSRSPSSKHRSHHRHRDSRDRRDKEHRRPRSSDRDSDRHERKKRRTPESNDRDRERRHHREQDREREREREREKDRDREIQRRNGSNNNNVKSEEDQQLEALRRGREERDRNFIKQERQDRQQQTQLRPEREDVQYQEWLSKEDEFMLSQAKKRAVIRVRENRPKPIDHFVINLNLIEEDERPRLLGDDEIEGDEFWMTQPEEVVEGLGGDEMAELKRDIEEYIRLENSPRNMEYWKAVMIILNDHQSKSATSLEARAVNTVVDDINKLLEPKTLEQLEKLEDQIQTKLRGDEPVDVDYWEQLLRSLKIWKAKAKIRAMHAPVLRARPNPPPKPAAPAVAKPANPFDPSNFADDAVHDDLLEDNDAFTRAAQSMFDTETTRIVEEGVEMDEPFNVEADDVIDPEPAWADQYKPRKPKFFNTVVMGYEWNKYNQTHYDEANPPPKVVQGYKFNIFYPNLIDTSKTPTYKVERNRQKRRYVGGGGGTSAGEDETCILRFIAGAPYQDIAFRIIDRDWDYSSRFNRGFKSSFDKGILQLHFQFKKVFYRK